MSHIKAMTDADASGEVAALYEADRGADCLVPNYTRAFGHRPEYMAAWKTLLGAIKKRMDPRRYELATFAAAKAIASSYCCLAQGSVLLNDFMSEAELLALAADHRDAGLSDLDVAIMDLAETVARDASTVSADQIGRLRRSGLDEGDICDVVAAAAARCFFSKYVDGVGAQADAKYSALSPELRQALIVGRAIAQA